MASYHLQVKTVKRSAGRSATAAAAYRSASQIFCAREGRMHDYARKQGVEEAFILAPEGAPDWAQDRASLWNAAEAAEVRRNAVTAREWELALPAEVSGAARREIAHGFARALVERYGVAADVAIHAPHREGDERNHHAHVLTTTRAIGADGFGAKTRVLDAAQTGGPEIATMRALWAEMQNRALEREGAEARVDHRSLEAQRDAALERGDAVAAEELGRAPEVKLGPAANAMERREARAAEAAGRAYAPVTERGRAVFEAREARAMFAAMREELRLRVELAREALTERRARRARTGSAPGWRRCARRWSGSRARSPTRGSGSGCSGSSSGRGRARSFPARTNPETCGSGCARRCSGRRGWSARPRSGTRGSVRSNGTARRKSGGRAAERAKTATSCRRDQSSHLLPLNPLATNSKKWQRLAKFILVKAADPREFAFYCEVPSVNQYRVLLNVYDIGRPATRPR